MSAAGPDAALDPQMRPIVEQLRREREGAPAFTEVPVAVMRARAREQFVYWNAAPPAVAEVRDLDARGAAGPVRVRLYDPHPQDTGKGALVFFHGGGWVIGDLDLEDTALRHLANDSGSVVFSVDYALAPEHKFPAPVEDCVATAQWLHHRAAAFGVDPARMALGGSSAGANLAVATALTLRERTDPWPRWMLLFYGAYAAEHSSSSHRRYGNGDYVLGTAMMEQFWTLYLAEPAQRRDPRAAPLLADLAGLPPAMLVAAGLDPLLDDSLALCARLTAAGVPAQCRIYPGVVHGFTLMSRSVDAARQALCDAGQALREALGSAGR